MTTAEAVQTCEDYGITIDDLRVGATSELLVTKSLGDRSKGQVRGLLERLGRILSPESMAGAIKWATWVAHARKANLPGTGVEELVKVRQGRKKV
jgi:hypothetical protein